MPVDSALLAELGRATWAITLPNECSVADWRVGVVLLPLAGRRLDVVHEQLRPFLRVVWVLGFEPVHNEFESDILLGRFSIVRRDGLQKTEHARSSYRGLQLRRRLVQPGRVDLRHVLR